LKHQEGANKDRRCETPSKSALFRWKGAGGSHWAIPCLFLLLAPKNRSAYRDH